VLVFVVLQRRLWPEQLTCAELKRRQQRLGRIDRDPLAELGARLADFLLSLELDRILATSGRGLSPV